METSSSRARKHLSAPEVHPEQQEMVLETFLLLLTGGHWKFGHGKEQPRAARSWGHCTPFLTVNPPRAER